MLVESGFKNVVVEAVELPLMEFDSFSEYWRLTHEMAGPIASLLEKLPPAECAVVEVEIAAEVAKLSPGGKVALEGVTWVAAGEK